MGGASGREAPGSDASMSTAPSDAGPGLPRAAPSVRTMKAGPPVACEADDLPATEDEPMPAEPAPPEPPAGRAEPTLTGGPAEAGLSDEAGRLGCSPAPTESQSESHSGSGRPLKPPTPAVG
jgi:hypothetical protein